MRTSISTIFSLLNFVHCFKCKAVQPINSLNLSSLILINQLLQTLQLPAFLPWDLMEANHVEYIEKFPHQVF